MRLADTVRRGRGSEGVWANGGSGTAGGVATVGEGAEPKRVGSDWGRGLKGGGQWGVLWAGLCGGGLGAGGRGFSWGRGRVPQGLSAPGRAGPGRVYSGPGPHGEARIPTARLRGGVWGRTCRVHLHPGAVTPRGRRRSSSRRRSRRRRHCRRTGPHCACAGRKGRGFRLRARAERKREVGARAASANRTAHVQNEPARVRRATFDLRVTRKRSHDL